MNKNNKHNISISSFLNIFYRTYALYTIENRGIPNWYDALTNVQRMILLNSPNNFEKTLILVGNVIKDGYHHGDRSLINAINRITREYNCSENLLIGDGFFGSPVNDEYAAPRYTSVKINPKIKEILNEYSHLNKKNFDGYYEYLNLSIPIGLTNLIIGIAVGYKTFILPRKIEDIKDFLEEKINTVNPYFKNFDGEIERKDKNLFLIKSKIKINEKDKEIEIKDIPHILKYNYFISKINELNKNYKFNIINNSSWKINLIIKYKDEYERWEEFKNKINFLTQILVREQIIFVKDRQIIQYNSIEDYLNDYKQHVIKIKYNNLIYLVEKLKEEKKFNESKLLYLKFMMEKKRNEKEINNFLNKFDKSTSIKLENILLKHLNIQEIIKTENKIIENNNNIKKINDELIKLKNIIKESYKLNTFKGEIKQNKLLDNVFNINKILEEESEEEIEKIINI